jgi:DNA-binding NtrC family response regulator
VIDDEAGIRRLLEALLRRDGWDVATAEDSTGAIDALHACHADLLLLDLGDDGERVLARLEAEQPGLRARSVFMSGSPPAGGRIDGRPVLGKPFAWQDLAAMLAQVTGSVPDHPAPGPRGAEASTT